MPNTPLYVHRLEGGIAALNASGAAWVDRRTLEEALGVSKWTAWRLLKRCGAEEGPGGSLVCRREELILRLEKLKADGTLGPEIERHKRVERYLESIVRFASSKHKEIARDEAASDLMGSRFAKLPEGVELRRGELRIRFRGTEDFLKKFGAVVFALHNDFEQISEFLETTTVGGNTAGGV